MAASQASCSWATSSRTVGAESLAAGRTRWAAELLHFWFHKLSPQDWFRPGSRVDNALRSRFERDLQALGNRPAGEFLTDPQSALAAVLLFDQIPRNLYRGTPGAFAYDGLARAISDGARARGWDRQLSRVERQFLYMPLMHSEHIADQLECLELFALLGRRFGMPFARSHYRMIARFGRFPHRNKVLGRRSTPAEERAVKSGFAW
ncbi:MAG: DUF924 domain-containing protein [Porphyrobacter sp.]|nr:DUF924 domain-containing protein [Porphyrobacter sp.]